MPRTSSIPWIRITVESALIVFSILLAFAIDAWWDGRREARLQQEWLSQLETEFEENLEELDLRIRQNRTGVERFEKFLRSTPAELAGQPPDTVRAWAYLFASPLTFDAAQGVSETLSEPEGLTAVPDPEIRTLVARWLGLLDDHREEASMMWSSGTEFVRVLSRPSLRGELPEGEPPRIWNSAANAGPDVLASWRANDELVSTLSVKMYYQRIYLSELLATRAVADSVLTLLRDG